jgi:hypothetical protein
MNIIKKSLVLLMIISNAYCFRINNTLSRINTTSGNNKILRTSMVLSDDDFNNINSFTNYLEKINNPLYYLNTVAEEKKTTYQTHGIKKIDFDKIFMNMSNIVKIYVSSNYDRYIFEFLDKSRGVYYIYQNVDKYRIERIINLVSSYVKIIVISDYGNIMDSIRGPLYCEEK